MAYVINTQEFANALLDELKAELGLRDTDEPATPNEAAAASREAHKALMTIYLLSKTPSSRAILKDILQDILKDDIT